MNKNQFLKQEILEKVIDYANLANDDIFISGKTKVNYAGKVYDKNELYNLIDASLDFWLTYGKYTTEFEQKFSKFLNIKYAFFVNSGSSANLLAFSTLTSPLLKERQVLRGDEIITVACGFPTTVAPIIQYGAVPVFVDVDLKTLNINVDYLEQALSNKTKAVMIAHTLGNPFNLDKVKEFCNKHNLWLIEDNCDALGSTYNNQYTGTFGDIGTSSFYPAHHMTTGEGGMVYTNNPILKKIMLSIRDWGRDCWCNSGCDNTCQHRFTKQYGKLPIGYDHKYVYSHFGYNLKGTDLQAAIGCAQLDKLENFSKLRREHYIYIKNRLADIKTIKVIEKTENSDPSWFGCPIYVNDDAPFTRTDLTKYLEENLVQTRNLFAGNILKHPCFDNLEINKDYRIASPLDNTDKIMNNLFWIGVYPGMTKDKLDYMINTIRTFCNK